ncbi:MAG TPA: class II SORL domain-containing protein [Candidatus Anoxymicrobiaceae bacterium]
MDIGTKYQHADWKTEKHVPAIDCPGEVKADELFEIKVSVGKEVAHPNTTEHHINWISVYFAPADEKFIYQLGHFEFNAHGESAAGANQGPVYTHHAVSAWARTNKPGTIYATSLCNIHGLWESSFEIKVT